MARRKAAFAVSGAVRMRLAAGPSPYAIDVAPDVASARAAALRAARGIAHWEAHAPLPPHTIAAFARLQAARRPQLPLALDAGCGTGRSTRLLAQALPAVDVFGVDRSAIRLQRGRNAAADALHSDANADVGEPEPTLVRADLPHLWRLLHSAGVRAGYQFFLYPNPSPRASHRKRRWHAHPAFPLVVALGGRVEVRASWQGYVEEFGAAFAAVAAVQGRALRMSEVHAVPQAKGLVLPARLTNFEAKYVDAGQSIHRLVLDMRGEVERRECPLAREDVACGWLDA